jgi:hypothetical protein
MAGVGWGTRSYRAPWPSSSSSWGPRGTCMGGRAGKEVKDRARAEGRCCALALARGGIPAQRNLPGRPQSKPLHGACVFPLRRRQSQATTSTNMAATCNRVRVRRRRVEKKKDGRQLGVAGSRPRSAAVIRGTVGTMREVDGAVLGCVSMGIHKKPRESSLFGDASS